MDLISQNFQNVSFPKNKDNRAFQPQWAKKFKWLEYSKSIDAVFCYACRQFGQFHKTNKVDPAFVGTGFSNWKMALQTGRGICRHDTSQGHLSAMSAWTDKLQRMKTNTEVSNLLTKSVLEMRRYYVTSLIEAVKYLVESEMPLRGTWSNLERVEDGNFSKLFQLFVRKDDKLKQCLGSIPSYAKYTSPQIQNELIAVMADVLREEIVEEVNSAQFFTLFIDGTKDKHHREVVSIAVRYIRSGVPVESVLAFETCENLDAKSISELVLAALERYRIDVKKMICQCYDGANVMRGKHGGVQHYIQQSLGRTLYYVHCFNHRLHLVVIDVIDAIQMVGHFFEQIKMIYDFFQRYKVKQIYEGTQLKRLISTRWAGHFKATVAVLKNYREVIAALREIKSHAGRKFDADTKVLADGILRSITTTEFVFMMISLHDLLEIIVPADQALQSRTIGYGGAMDVINAVTQSIKDLRETDKFDEFFQKAEQLLQTEMTDSTHPRPVRNRRSSLHSGSILTERVGERSDLKTELKSAYFQAIDVMLLEMDRRFSDNSDVLFALSTASELDEKKLEALKPAGIKIPSSSELVVAKRYIDDAKVKFVQNGGKETEFNVLQTISKMKEVFEDTVLMLEAVDTFGCSTAICEASFSCLSRIGTLSRFSMSSQRLRDLSFLAFESKRLEKIDENKILRKFNDDKQRRLQLF